MAKRNLIMDNIRGLAMLGVIGIHAAGYVMESGTPWLWLDFLFDVLSRFSVPAFFFISGYGLFLQHPLEQKLDYGKFLRGRAHSILVPYVVWSFLYLYIWHTIPWNPLAWKFKQIAAVFFFAEASYQLYFLVILWWFYVTLPWWRQLAAWLLRHSLCVGLVLLTVLQGALYVWSAGFWVYPGWMSKYPILIKLLNERFNYCPLFYGLVFMLGAAAALRWPVWSAKLKHGLGKAAAFYLGSVALLVYLYREYYGQGMALEEIPEHLQQLSLPGLLYTLTSLLFLCALFYRLRFHKLALLQSLSRHSYVIYLIHPFYMDSFYYYLKAHGILFSSVPMPLYYLAVLGCSWASSILIRHFSGYFPLLGRLLMGSR